MYMPSGVDMVAMELTIEKGKSTNERKAQNSPGVCRVHLHLHRRDVEPALRVYPPHSLSFPRQTKAPSPSRSSSM